MRAAFDMCHFLKLLNCVSVLTVTETCAGVETEITATVMTAGGGGCLLFRGDGAECDSDGDTGSD